MNRTREPGGEPKDSPTSSYEMGLPPIFVKLYIVRICIEDN